LSQHTTYDYIITGAGCAGLSLAMQMIHSGHAASKKILIIDKDAKNRNDRTWCFWEKEKGLFENIVKKQWKQLRFYSATLERSLDIQPYAYKLIRGIDFYQHCISVIHSQPNIEWLQAPVEALISNERETAVMVGQQKIYANYIFNSILFNKPSLKDKHHWMLQHFKGWFIKTDKPSFDPEVGTLMDFRTDQKEGATFFYVLPFTSTEALVEYTLFSPALLEDTSYEMALHNYLTQQLGIDSYEIIEKEFGVIPMTNFAFPKQHHHILNIGTAGGQTKGSSGYTFQFIQKQAKAITDSLNRSGHPFSSLSQQYRFQFYDSVLLDVLQKKRVEGWDVFSQLFKKNKGSAVFKFLDNETNLAEEIRIISTLPTLPFSKAAVWHFMS
jgi:lycopene beta-cyclase